MPHGVPIELWKDDAIRRKFRSMVKQSERTVVSWSKFRKLDKDGIFAQVTDVTLAGFNRRITFKESGLCIACGKGKPEKGKNVCKRCGEVAKRSRIEYYARTK